MATNLDMSAPCIVFALRRESMHFRRAYRFAQRFPGAPCLAQFRGSVLMLESGVGAAAMETALHWCLNGPRFGGEPYRPRFLLCAGFSGALQSEQRVGDTFVATEVIDQQGNHWPALHPSSLLGRDIAAGRLLSVPQLVSHPCEKQRLGQQYQALAVDMESAVAARLCRQFDVPFACLRVISDDWQTPLSPYLVDLLRQGRVSIPRLASKVLRHPVLIGELRRLAAQTRQASRELLEPLEWMISAIQSECYA
jgi:nucleoside phosphorylase